jgi:hypothetical protein
MNTVTREQLEQHFQSPNIPSEVIFNTSFEFQEVQAFLNRNGYEIFIKEQRYQRNQYNSNDDYCGSIPALTTRLVVVPIGTVLPEILPEAPKDYYNEPTHNYDLWTTFSMVLRNKLLNL